MKNYTRLTLSILPSLLIGLVGAVFTSANIPTWYAALNKPMLNPPNWIFGPVWTSLYILMGISLYLVWNQKTRLKKTNAYIFYTIQLILNLIWSYIFFTLRLPPIALVEIVILWLSIAITIIKFRAINKTAAYLLTPYILWVSFATYLNYMIVALN